MKKHHVVVSSFQFKRTKTEGLIHVLNARSCVMAEYGERTGAAERQRVVLATQKELFEKRLGEHYPVQAAAAFPTCNISITPRIQLKTNSVAAQIGARTLARSIGARYPRGWVAPT